MTRLSDCTSVDGTILRHAYKQGDHRLAIIRHVTIASAAGVAGKPTIHAKRIVTEGMLSRGRQFTGAALLLRQQKGSEFVVLHLMCQGIECVLKGILLAVDYDRYRPMLKQDRRRLGYGHDISKLAVDVLAVLQLAPMRQALAAELSQLNALYSQHLLRYGSMVDIFFNPSLAQSNGVLRRHMAGLRLLNRATRKKGGA